MKDIYRKIGAMKVVLVEDDELVRENIAVHFRLKGCPLKTFRNVEEATDSFEIESPDLVISDYLLPGRDGLSFLKQVAREHPRTRKILTTAFPEDLPADVLRKAGIDALLLKPFGVEEMEGVLEQVIEAGTRGNRGNDKEAN